jgi:hypothetical protein
MKKKLAALVLSGLLLLTVLSARAQDGDKGKPLYHVTVWVSGLTDTIELDDVRETKASGGPGESIFGSANGSILMVPSDKVLAVLFEPMTTKKRAQDDKQPK